MKEGFAVVSVRLTAETVKILRKIAHKKESAIQKNVWLTDCIKYALNKTFKGIKEKVPPVFEEDME